MQGQKQKNEKKKTNKKHTYPNFAQQVADNIECRYTSRRRHRILRSCRRRRDPCVGRCRYRCIITIRFVLFLFHRGRTLLLLVFLWCIDDSITIVGVVYTVGVAVRCIVVYVATGCGCLKK